MDRKFSPSDLERITCDLMAQGYTPEEVWSAVEVCAGDPCATKIIELAIKIMEFLITIQREQLRLAARSRAVFALLDALEFADLHGETYIDARDSIEAIQHVPETMRIIEGEYEVLKETVLMELPNLPEGTEVTIPDLPGKQGS